MRMHKGASLITSGIEAIGGGYRATVTVMGAGIVLPTGFTADGLTKEEAERSAQELAIRELDQLLASRRLARPVGTTAGRPYRR